MKDIIVVSLNPAIDRNYKVFGFVPGKLFRCENPVVSPGGKGVNVARIISLLGGRVSLLGFFAGNNGKYIVDNLVENKVKVLPVFINGETRNSINILDKVSGQETEILEKGPVVTKENIQSLKEILFNEIGINDSGKIVVFSGGIPEGVFDDIYFELIIEANSRGAICFLDSSSQALLKGVDARPFFVKPNLREFGQIAKHLNCDVNFGDKQEISIKNIMSSENLKKIYEVFKALKINCLVITLSEKGALLIDRNKITYMNPPEIVPVNTIGSGDSFTAGFAYAFANGLSFSDCLKTAGACGTSNALFEQVGVIDRKKVDEFINNIEIQEKMILIDE